MKDETTLINLLFIAGKVSGADLISHTLSCITEHKEAQLELYRLAKSLAKLQSEGHIDVKVERGEHMWFLTKDASRDWCNEVLNVDEAETH